MKRYLLEGKTAIVTGASQGIGQAIAELFAEEGASVVLTGRREPELQKVVEKIREAGGKAIGVPGDVSSEASCKETFTKAIDEFGQVDIVVNNAGKGEVVTIEGQSLELFEEICAINLRGPFLYCREAVRHMLPQNSGVIVNVSSVNGTRPMCGTSYCATKAGLNGMTKNIAIRLVGTNIRINALSPGPTLTEAKADMEAGKKAPMDYSMLEILTDRTVRNVPTQAGDQARVALFLASDLSRGVTGQILEVDNGAFL